MADDEVGCMVLGYLGAADDERDVDIFFVAAGSA